jgi:signal transduction histidine kinase
MTKEKMELLEKTLHTIVDVGFGLGNLDLLSDIVSKDIVLIGTTYDEKIFGLKETLELIKRQREQITGGELHYDVKTLDVHISADDNTAILTNEGNLYITVDTNTIDIYLRFSAVFEYILNKWVMVHWHASKPELVESEKDTWGIKSWKEKAEALEKVVAERTAELIEKNRELEIEAALERVRARTMAMQKSDELNEVAFILFEQIRQLGGSLWGTGFALCNTADGEDEFWFANEMGVMPPVHIPNTEDKVHQAMFASWKNREEYLLSQMEGRELAAHYEYLNSLPAVKAFFEPMLKAGHQFPTWQQWHSAYFSKGYLLFITTKPYPYVDIFKRFAQVFDQTYTRFLDLKKAETQAREAQIEAALEKVRSRTMGMQRSEQLGETASLLFKQFENLGINVWSSGFQIWNTDDISSSAWMSSAGGEIEHTGLRLPHTEDPYFINIYQARHNPDRLFVMESKGKELEDTYRYMFNIPEWKKAFGDIEASGFPIPTYQITHCVYFTHGYLMLITHESYPEYWDIFKRFGKVFDQTYTRFLDLQKAEAQAREAQIETALERLRAKAMGMQKSDELHEVLAVLFEQFDILDIRPMSTHMTILDIENNKFTFRETGKYGNRSYGEHTFALDAMDTWDDMVNSWRSSEPFSINRLHFPKETLPRVWEVFKESFASMPEESRITPADYPDGIYHTAGKHPFGYIGMNQIRPATAEEEQIVMKFANEFGRFYQRFLDLQKAEAQAREAQIEAALEKVRSVSLSMHKSEELNEVVTILFEKLKELQIPFTAVGIAIGIEDSKDLNAFVCGQNEEGLVITNYRLPYFNNPIPKDLYNALYKQSDFFVGHYSKEEKDTFYEYVIEHTAEFRHLPEDIKRMIFDSPTYTISMVAVKNAVFNINDFGGKLLTDNEVDIIKRFARVFDQAYTRFLDLQKAEMQARESRIETALEKVRSRTMGMQSSEELPEVSNLLFLEVQALGIPAWSCGYCILLEDKKSSTCIMSSEGTLQKPFLLPHSGESSFEEWDYFVHSDQSFLIQELGGKAIESHYGFMKSLPQLTPVLKELEDAGLSLPAYQINHLCKFNHGFLLFITYNKVERSHEIFKRFTKVFDQTYTRFLDLKKAEEMAREARIDLSLERIRSKATAMRISSDLLDIVVTMRSEFISLGHEAQYFWQMRWLPDKFQKAMTSGDGTKIGMVMELPRDFHSHYKGMDDWENNNEPIMVLALETEMAVDYIHKMITLGNFQQVDPNAPTLDDIRHIGGITFVMARTTHGEIGYSLSGVVPHPPEEDINTLLKFANVFDLAYKRFLDLRHAEEQALMIKEEKERLEVTLSNLRATQSQLIQSEKMASLGELTAGIAHEIQNPLNFVNNFSEVSSELIDEMKIELINNNIEDAIAIAEDIRENLEKINHHGKRADGIVKGMLQHSRNSTGQKELIDINALADEYLRLSYHGLRAKDRLFNAKFEIQIDKSIPLVSVVPQDLGRVILNLLNNAFYAVHEKNKGGIEKYEPTVIVRTKKYETHIEISIIDNGNGIPEPLKAKIFQPFFTTKPTGQGTGLGLSLSYDIVKAHGGELQVKSEKGIGTELIIKLPPANNLILTQ